jgi:hypothetical protein
MRDPLIDDVLTIMAVLVNHDTGRRRVRAVSNGLAAA